MTIVIVILILNIDRKKGKKDSMKKWFLITFFLKWKKKCLEIHQLNYQKKAYETHQNLSEEEKEKKNIDSKDIKNRLVE